MQDKSFKDVPAGVSFEMSKDFCEKVLVVETDHPGRLVIKVPKVSGSWTL